LPRDAEVPQNGRKFEQAGTPMKGTAGRRTKIIVNHYEVQSLPIIKTYTYDVSRYYIPTLLSLSSNTLLLGSYEGSSVISTTR
jgi:hypothetical protein